MIRKFSSTTLKSTLIVGLVLVLALNVVDAKKRDRNSETESSSTTLSTDTALRIKYHHQGSVIIELNSDGVSGAGEIVLIVRAITFKIKSDSLTSYMLEKNLQMVEITAEMFEFTDGSLLFAFSPSGAYFGPPAELAFSTGNYAARGVILVSESGELIEYTTKQKGNTITFYIPHFSRYSYDHYDY